MAVAGKKGGTVVLAIHGPIRLLHGERRPRFVPSPPPVVGDLAFPRGIIELGAGIIRSGRIAPRLAGGGGRGEAGGDDLTAVRGRVRT